MSLAKSLIEKFRLTGDQESYKERLEDIIGKGTVLDYKLVGEVFTATVKVTRVDSDQLLRLQRRGMALRAVEVRKGKLVLEFDVI